MRMDLGTAARTCCDPLCLHPQVLLRKAAHTCAGRLGGMHAHLDGIHDLVQDVLARPQDALLPIQPPVPAGREARGWVA